MKVIYGDDITINNVALTGIVDSVSISNELTEGGYKEVKSTMVTFKNADLDALGFVPKTGQLATLRGSSWRLEIPSRNNYVTTVHLISANK